jgi:hypothetical protein
MTHKTLYATIIALTVACSSLAQTNAPPSGPFLEITAEAPAPDGIVYRIAWSHPYRPGGSHAPHAIGHLSRVFTPPPIIEAVAMASQEELPTIDVKPAMDVNEIGSEATGSVGDFLDEMLDAPKDEPETEAEPSERHHAEHAAPRQVPLLFNQDARPWLETPAFSVSNRLQAGEASPRFDLGPHTPRGAGPKNNRPQDEAMHLFIRAFSGERLAPDPLKLKLSLYRNADDETAIVTGETTSGYFGVQLRHPNSASPRFESRSQLRERWYAETRRILANRKGREFFVSPKGRRSATGTREDPMSLDRALTATKTVQPGDTVWLMTGTYIGPTHEHPPPPPLAPPDKNADLVGLKLPSLDGDDLELGELGDIDTAPLEAPKPMPEPKKSTLTRYYFTSLLEGTEAEPIIVRALPGHGVNLVGGLKAKSAHTWFWGFSIGEPPERANSRGKSSTVEMSGPGCRLINLHIYGHRLGPSMADTSQNDREIYGCIMHDLGYWPDIPRGESFRPGIGLGMIPVGGLTRLTDNIIFHGYGPNILAPSWDQPLYNLHLEGNTLFSAGAKGEQWSDKTFVMNWHDPTWQVSVIDNLFYQPEGASRNVESIGYTPLMGVHSGGLEMRGNHFEGGKLVLELGTWNSLIFADNVVRGPTTLMKYHATVEHADGIRHTDNTYVSPRSANDTNAPALFDVWGTRQNFGYWSSRKDRSASFVSDADHESAGPHVRVRPNRYESGRAHVSVTAWGERESVAVDLSEVLKAGSAYEVLHVSDLEQSVVEGIYEGQAVSFPRKDEDGLPGLDVYLVVAVVDDKP